MTVVLTTPTLNLVNPPSYGLVSIDLGENRRDEVWVEPFSADTPVLAKVVNRRTKVTITLILKGTSPANVVALAEAVRDQFNGQSNTLTYSIGGTNKVMTTYDSQIDPLPFGDNTILWQAATGQFLVNAWTFQVTRDSKFQSDTRPPVA